MSNSDGYLFILGASGGLGSGLVEFFSQGIVGFPEFNCIVGVTREDMDLTCEESVQSYWKKIAADTKSTQKIYVINAAGRSINGMCHKLSLESWNRNLDDNLTSNFLLMKHFRNNFRNRSGSSILTYSSVVARRSVMGTAAYSSAKNGLAGLVKTAALEMGRQGITVNCIELGYFDRGMIEQLSSDQLESVLKAIPINRLGNINDLAKASHFALTCSYLSGSVVSLNGGVC